LWRGWKKPNEHTERTKVERLNEKHSLYEITSYCYIYLQLKSSDHEALRFYPKALSIYGNWLADTRSENPNIIMEQYMEKVGIMFGKRFPWARNCCYKNWTYLTL